MSAIIMRSHLKIAWDSCHFPPSSYGQMRTDQKWHWADLLVLNILAASSLSCSEAPGGGGLMLTFKNLQEGHTRANTNTHTHTKQKERGGGGAEGDNGEIFSITVRSASTCPDTYLLHQPQLSCPPTEPFKLSRHGNRRWAEHNPGNTTMHGVKCQF